MDTATFIFTPSCLASCCNVFHTFCMAASNYRVVCNLHAIMVYNAKARRWILSTAARRPRTAPIALPIPSFCNLSSDRKGYAISVRFVAHPTMGSLARLIISTRKLSCIHIAAVAVQTRLLRNDSGSFIMRVLLKRKTYSNSLTLT